MLSLGEEEESESCPANDSKDEDSTSESSDFSAAFFKSKIASCCELMAFLEDLLWWCVERGDSVTLGGLKLNRTVGNHLIKYVHTKGYSKYCRLGNFYDKIIHVLNFCVKKIFRCSMVLQCSAYTYFNFSRV